MINSDTLKFFKFFLRSYPLRSSLAILLLGIAGVLEGVGVAALIPVLEAAEGSGSQSGVSLYLGEILGIVGLEPTMATLLVIIVFLVLVKSASVWLALTQVGSTVIWVVGRLRSRLVRALLGARWSHFTREQAGAWANAVSAEAVATGAAYREACEMLGAVFPIAVYMTFATIISWQTSIFVAMSALVVFGFLRGFVALSRRAGHDSVMLAKSLAGRTADVLQGLKPIKAMGREHLIVPVFEEEIVRLDAASRRGLFAAWNLRFFHEPSVTALLGFGIFFLVTIGGLPLAEIMVLAFMFYRVMTHLGTLQMRYQVVVVGEASFWSLMDRIEAAETAREALDGGMPVEPIQRDVRLVDVRFSYSDHEVLRGLDLVIPTGRFVSILGESGSGKTTLADLVAGLRRPDSGKVLVDGTDLSELSLGGWRKQIGYVPQEMLLLNDTIRTNVSLGDPDITEGDVERALRLAGAWEFVDSRQGGLDAQVGDRGAELSGGQRQRIAIARALVSRPSMLILDEVTTALDPDTEAAICQTLRDLAGEVTILSISHQPAMRKVADEAYLMRNGKLMPITES